MKTFNHVEGLPYLKDLVSEKGDGGRHYISPTGKRLPSVTTVLGYFKRHQIAEWRAKVGEDNANRISTRASNRGTLFHSMMEKYLMNNNNLFEGVMPDMKQSFHDVKEAVDRIDNIHYIEGQMFSERLGLAGRTDCIAEYNGVLSIIDFKTSLRPKKREWIENYFEQGTAYAMMYEELVGNPIDNIVIIISTDDHSQPLQVFEENKYDYIQSLLEKIHIYKQENK